jgi:fused signal recognition particle receptor
VKATQLLVDKVTSAPGERREVLESEIARLLSGGAGESTDTGPRPRVVMVVGVNGSGKTTSVGKLCRHFRDEGKTVLLAAADTYRDAASEQLSVWAERAGVEIVASVQGQDAAAVAFDAISKGMSSDTDIVLVDTAGRLHTRADLMAEVVKIKRVCGKVRDGAPDEVWLVLDATVGQNGLRQAVAFHEQLSLTGIVVAKLDGTAKGGVLIPIAMELGVPIRFVGTGEGIEDLERFDPEAYARALFDE